MVYDSQTRDFCKSVSESYMFDNESVGLEHIASGATVRQVSQSDLADSGKFKREVLARKLDEEPNRSMTLRMDTYDLSLSHVLREDGFAYSTSHPPRNAEGCYVFKPVPIGERKLSREEKRKLLRAA